MEVINNKEFYGVTHEQTSDTDWLGEDIVIPRSPKGTDSFIKNGSIQYRQNDVSNVSCTIHGAMGAYSALTGYTFSLDERKKLWDEALKLGADPKVGWTINKAVDLVRHYINDNLPIKVSSYRIELGSYEHSVAMRLGYSVIIGYRGNKIFRKDRDDNDIIDEVDFGTSTYGHCLHSCYSIGDEYDCIVDSYFGRDNNIFMVPSANWKILVGNGVFFKSGYIFIPA